MENITKLSGGDNVIFTGSKIRRNENRRFEIGSIESFNAKTCDQFRKPVEEDLAKARRLGHATAWTLPEPCVIVDTKSYPGYYEAQQKLRDVSVRVPVGSVVEVSGRHYVVIDEPNENIGLIELPEDGKRLQFAKLGEGGGLMFAYDGSPLCAIGVPVEGCVSHARVEVTRALMSLRGKTLAEASSLWQTREEVATIA